MKMSLRFLIGVGVGILVPDALPRLMANDFTKDSPMYGIGEPQLAVPPKFRQSNAAMTKKGRRFIEAPPQFNSRAKSVALFNTTWLPCVALRKLGTRL